MNLRAATDEDLTQLAYLHEEHHIILSQSDPRFGKDDRACWIEQTRRRLNSAHHCCFVGEADQGIIAGYILAHTLADGTGIIDELVLDAHTYHGGLGRRLWYALREWFTQQSVQCVRIRVPRYHAVEQAFWRALGAVEWKDEPCPPHLIWMTL